MRIEAAIKGNLQQFMKKQVEAAEIAITEAVHEITGNVKNDLRSQVRSAGLGDNLLVSIGALIAANRTLSGLAEWSEAKAPDFIDEPIEGAATVRAATMAVLLRFSTTDPLN